MTDKELEKEKKFIMKIEESKCLLCLIVVLVFKVEDENPGNIFKQANVTMYGTE